MSTDGEYYQYISAAYLERLTQELLHDRKRTHTEMGGQRRSLQSAHKCWYDWNRVGFWTRVRIMGAFSGASCG
jgi:hypothetical protein